MVPSGLEWVNRSTKHRCFCQLETIPLNLRNRRHKILSNRTQVFQRQGLIGWVLLSRMLHIMGAVLWMVLEIHSLCDKRRNSQLMLFKGHHK